MLLLRPIISSKIGDFSKMETQKPIMLRATEGSRSSRRVDKIVGEQAEGLPSVEGRWAVVSTMARWRRWRRRWGWHQRGTDVEVTQVPVMVVASNGDDWRRMVASMGGRGVDTEGADVEVSPSVSPVVMEARTGVGWFFLLDREKTMSSFGLCLVERFFATVAVWFVWQIATYLCLPVVVMILIIVTCL